MRFDDEDVPIAELEDVLPEKAPKANKREQEMAEQLIESLSTDFEPSAYHDEYREQLLSLIERKAEGKEIVASEAEAPKATKTPDLMAALEESIAAVKDRPARKSANPKPAKAKAKSSSKAGKKPTKASAKSKSSKASKSKKSSSRAKSKSK